MNLYGIYFLTSLITADSVKWRLTPTAETADNLILNGSFVRSWNDQLSYMKQTSTAVLKARAAPLPNGVLGPKSKVLYGVFTSGSPEYRAKLEAQMDTWAKSIIAENRFIALAGRNYPTHLIQPGVVESVDCSDHLGGLSCKEAHLIAEAAKRGTDWIFIIGEDNYVDTLALEQRLRAYSPDDVQGLGCVGCGVGISKYGERISKHGSFCGGCGYALSRASLTRLTDNGVDNLVAEYGGREHQLLPNEMNTGKALLARGGEIVPFSGGLEGNPIFSVKGFKAKLRDHTIVYHYLSPQQMRWLHALKTTAPDKLVKDLESEAFDELGCPAGKTKIKWHANAEECRQRGGDYH